MIHKRIRILCQWILQWIAVCQHTHPRKEKNKKKQKLAKDSNAIKECDIFILTFSNHIWLWTVKCALHCIRKRFVTEQVLEKHKYRIGFKNAFSFQPNDKNNYYFFGHFNILFCQRQQKNSNQKWSETRINSSVILISTEKQAYNML